MRKRMKQAAGLLLLMLSYFVVLEGLLALVFTIHQDYDLEMWKYNRELKRNVGDSRAHVHIPGRSARLMGVDVHINSMGFREKEPGAKTGMRIAVFGDSFTLGWGVEEANTYVRRLEQLLREECGLAVEVFNFGVGNYNSIQVAEAIRRQASAVHPDLILYGFYWNDAEPVQEEADGIWEKSLYLSAFWRKVKMRVFSRPEGFLSYYGSLYEGAGWNSFALSLEEIRHATQETGAELAVALLPELRNLKDGLAERSYAKVERHFLDRGVPVVNLLGALKSGDSSVYWVAKDDPHPNALAQMEIARMLRDRLFSSCRMPASPGKKGRKEK